MLAASTNYKHLFGVCRCLFRPKGLWPASVRSCFSGPRGVEITFCQLFTMVDPELGDEALSPSGSVGRGICQQTGSDRSQSQTYSPRDFSSNGSVSPLDPSLHYEPQETDFLLPNMLYGRSTVSGPPRAKDAGGSGAPAESVCCMVLQILVPFVLAGLGTVSAGMLLGLVQVRNVVKGRRTKGCFRHLGVFPDLWKLHHEALEQKTILIFPESKEIERDETIEWILFFFFSKLMGLF